MSSFGAVDFKVVAPKIAPHGLFAQPRRLSRLRRESEVVGQPFVASILPVIIACHAGTCPKAALTEND